MTDLLVKTLTATFTAVVISVMFRLLGSGRKNSRFFYLGLAVFLIFPLILAFDASRKRYTADDYVSRQITVARCETLEPDKSIIVTPEGEKYSLDSAFLRRAGNKADLEKIICSQRSLSVWLSHENEISGIRSEQVSIPLEVGIKNDDSNHDFLIVGYLFGFLGFLLMFLAIVYDWMGVKIDLKSGRSFRDKL